jgi:hypothetical protein
MNKIDLIIDTIHELMYSNSTAVAMQKYYAALAAAKELREELTKPEECVCCGDYEKCIKPCTPKGRWLAEKELARPEHTFDTPESHIVKWSIPVDPNNFGEPLVQVKQSHYSDIVSNGGLDPRNKFDAPPRKPWVGLTQEDRDGLLNYSTNVPSRLIDWTEEKLKEKNEH